MTVQKLVLLGHISSSSDAFQSKKALAQRKKMLKLELLKKTREAAMAMNNNNNSMMANLVDNDNIISSPNTSFDEPQSRRTQSFLSTRVQQQRSIIASGSDLSIEPVLSIASSTSSLEMSSTYNDDDEPNVPSAHIRKIFQRAAPVENTGRGGALVQRAIEDQQTKLIQKKKEKEKQEEAANDLRSIYQRYLSGQIEKESVVRSGEEWTSRYRERRRMQRRQNLGLPPQTENVAPKSSENDEPSSAKEEKLSDMVSTKKAIAFVGRRSRPSISALQPKQVTAQ